MNVVVNEAFIKEHRNNPDFYEIIYQQYEKLIHKVAHKYFIKGYEHEDLVSEGAIKLLYVLNKWNPDLDTKFSTYLVSALHNHYKILLRQQGAKKRGDEIITISLDTPVSENRDILIKDILKDDSSLSAFDLKPSAESLLLKYCSLLKNERDLKVILLYYIEELNQTDIAKLLNVSQAQISRIIMKHSNNIKDYYERGQI